MAHPSTKRLTVLAALCVLVAAGVLTVPLAFSQPDGQGPSTPLSAPPVPQLGRPARARITAVTSSSDAAAKITEPLAAAVEAAQGSATAQLVNVAILSRGEIDIEHLAEKAVSTTWPLGRVVTLARIDARLVPKVAALDEVELVEDGLNPDMPNDEWIDPDLPPRIDPVKQRARIEALRASEVRFAEAPVPLVMRDTARPGTAARDESLDRAGNEQRLEGWYDVIGSHFSKKAWDLGWRGEGVRVGVSDSGADFNTPSLVGTWAVIEDEASPYNGWPQALDAQGLFVYVQDAQLETNNAELGAGGVLVMSQTSMATRTWDGRNEPVGRACFRRVLKSNERDQAPVCDYKVPWRSRSGVYRFGVHPDAYLANVYNERPGVLLVDEARSGRYDTVYVDLDNDHDFTDEKPVTKEDPLSYRDMDGDGWVDLSGGLLYWISDGKHQPPGGYLWGELTPTPKAGEVVAFIGAFSGQHGNYCASNVAAQPNVPVPEGVEIRFRDLPGDGVPKTLLVGAAPGAKVVAVRRGGVLVTQSTYIYAARGHSDQIEGDELQILSNSYPLEKPMNEGWDYTSRLVDHLTTENPHVAYVFSSGNGGPGYGSIRDPHPRTGIKVGASTQIGSTGYDSITETTQITWGDIISFSSNGPGSDGTAGVHVAADGAYASGAIGINSVFDGSRTTITWGGTSRSTPVASGNLALVYQAFKDKHGRWPTWREARSLLMAGAQFTGYDSFLAGSGVVDGGQSAKIAGGVDGVYALPELIEPGDYRGVKYRSFPSLMGRGESDQVEIGLVNDSDEDVRLELSGQSMRRIGSYEFDWQSQPVGGESKYYGHHPDYIIPIPKDRIPDGTELLAIRMIQPLEESDLGLDYSRSSSRDNYFYLFAYQHTDMDGDGLWWEDKNGDGIANHATLKSSHQLDGILDTDWEATEWDRWEYARIGQDTSPTNNAVMWVHHPLERWSDGLYIGLVHRGRNAELAETSKLKFRLDFYRYQDWDWLSLDQTSVTVAASSTLTVTLDVAVPQDAAYGYHQGALFGRYLGQRPDASPYHRLTIPVMVNVAAELDIGEPPPHGFDVFLPAALRGAPVQGEHRGQVLEQVSPRGGLRPLVLAGAEISPEFGGQAGQDADLPYPNGLVRGAQRWGYGPESGDWRFYHLEVPASGLDGTRLVLRSSWDDVWCDSGEGQTVPRTDIDTRVFAPASDRWSDPDHPDNEEEDLSAPELFGPQTTALLAESMPQYTGSGTWRFQTATDDYEEWVLSGVKPGLNVIMAHNFLTSGRFTDVPFSLVIDRARLLPQELRDVESGCGQVSLTPSFTVADLTSEGFGLSRRQGFEDQPIGQDDPNDPRTASWTHTFSVTHGASIEVSLTGQEGTDLDLFLYYDSEGDGSYTTQLASSTTPTAIEHILVGNPDDGSYQVAVHGWDVPSGQSTFDLLLDAVQGDGVTAKGLPQDGVEAGEELTFQVCYDLPPHATAGDYNGVLYFGPSRVPRLFDMPISVSVR